MRTGEGTVRADYQKIELHAGRGGQIDLYVDNGLVCTWEDDYAVLTTARQHGQLPVRSKVHDERPPLDPVWDAVVELALRSGEGAEVTGWAGEGNLPIPVDPGLDLRARYVVVDGQAGSEQFADRWWLAAVVDAALSDHPEVAERLRGGDVRHRIGVIRYVQELFRETHAMHLYDDRRSDHRRIERLVDERVDATR